MRTTLCAILVLVVSAASVAAQTAQPGAAAPTASDKAAGESFRHSATAMVLARDAQGYAQRLVALCRMAHALVPDDPQVNRILSVIHRGQGKLDPAAKACETYLKAYPADHGMGMSWLAFAEETFNTSDERLAWMGSVAQRSDLGAPLRAEAWGRVAETRTRRGAEGYVAQADEAIKQALELDPLNATALRVQLNLHKGVKPPSKAKQATYLLAMLKASGGHPEIATNLAMMLQAIGLHEESLLFYRYLLDLSLGRSPGRQVPYSLVLRLTNALLDAGKPREAIELLQPQLKREQFKLSVDSHSLAAEAFRALGQPGLAQEQITSIKSVFDRYQAAEKTVGPQAARQLAMFYVMSQPESGEAIKYAKIAVRADPRDAVAQRLLGSALVASKDEADFKRGQEILTGLSEKDLYALTALAEHYYARGMDELGRKTILAVGDLGHEGPAFRKLEVLAKKKNVPIAPVEGRQAVAIEIQRLDKRILQMASEPEKFLAVAVEPTRRKYVPGEPIEVDVVFRNIGPLVMPLGQVGLCRPVVRLIVTDDVDKERFDGFPLALLPAPRYLAMGKSVRTRVRLDVGKLAASLAKDPLTERTLIVTGQVDPREVRGKKELLSTVPSVKISPAKITRVDLLGEFERGQAAAWAKQYKLTLGLITQHDILKGEIPQRMRAARQVGALLTLARAIERGTSKPPTALASRVTTPMLLRMLQEVLKDRDAAVRAEMVLALRHVAMDKHVLQQLGQAGVIDDPSPLVRLRIAELFGGNPSRGSGKIVRFLVDDRDELVAMMAKVFR